MKKIIFILTLMITSLFAEVKHAPLTQELLDSKIPIVDIRTTGEWVETGIVKSSIPIMFFNERGSYDAQAFLAELNKKVDTKKPFALICRTGSRTKVVSNFLDTQLGYSVTNISGGIMYHKMKTIPLVRYK